MINKLKFIKIITNVVFLNLFFSSFSFASSSLPECEGSSFPTWTNCHGKIGPLPVSGDIYDGEFKDGKYHGKGTLTLPDGRILKGTPPTPPQRPHHV